MAQAFRAIQARGFKSMKRIEFTPPAGVVPEGTKAGEDFDLVSTFRVKNDGQICLVQVGDVKLPGYSDKADKGRASYADEHKAMLGTGGGETQTGYA